MTEEASVTLRQPNIDMDGGTMSSRKSYGLPENFNPSDHPPVKLRHPHSSSDRSETQRKRRSKNRLSNRRSTGYVTGDIIEDALNMGPNGEYNSTNAQENRNNV